MAVFKKDALLCLALLLSSAGEIVFCSPCFVLFIPLTITVSQSPTGQGSLIHSFISGRHYLHTIIIMNGRNLNVWQILQYIDIFWVSTSQRIRNNCRGFSTQPAIKKGCVQHKFVPFQHLHSFVVFSTCLTDSIDSCSQMWFLAFILCLFVTFIVCINFVNAHTVVRKV